MVYLLHKMFFSYHRIQILLDRQMDGLVGGWRANLEFPKLGTLEGDYKHIPHKHCPAMQLQINDNIVY